jgi:GNAT superfamily N-acetyltransferase
MELVMLLAEGFGLSPATVIALRMFKEDELYTVTYGNKIVACVFITTFDPLGFWAEDDDPESKALRVRAFTVSPQHRRLGIASRLLILIKNKSSKDRMLWIDLKWKKRRHESRTAPVHVPSTWLYRTRH